MNFEIFKFNCINSIGITPKITQLKFYMPDEGLFYGYCHKAKYHCSWNVHTDMVVYVEESTYIEKLMEVNMISASGIDDMTLGIEATASNEDPNIGRKIFFVAKCISKRRIT